MRQRMILVLVRAAITVLIAGLSTPLLKPAAADAVFLTYDTPSYSYDGDANDSQIAAGDQGAPNGDGAVEVAEGAPASQTAGHVHDPAR